MNKRTVLSERGHVISGFFVFCLIGMFAVMAATLTLTGIRAYRGVEAASGKNSEGQFAYSYLLNKVHAADHENGVGTQTENGMTVLCLRDTWEGTVYETRIFCRDGYLQEYYCEGGEPFDASLGETLTELADMTVEAQGDGLLALRLRMPDGETQVAHIALRTKGAMSP